MEGLFVEYFQTLDYSADDSTYLNDEIRASTMNAIPPEMSRILWKGLNHAHPLAQGTRSGKTSSADCHCKDITSPCLGSTVWVLSETGMTTFCLQHATQLRDFAAGMDNSGSVNEVMIGFNAVQEERAAAIMEVIGRGGLCFYCDGSFVPVSGKERLAWRFPKYTRLKHVCCTLCWNLVAYRRKIHPEGISEEELVVLGRENVSKRAETQELARMKAEAEKDGVDLICFYCQRSATDFLKPSTTGRKQWMCYRCHDCSRWSDTKSLSEEAFRKRMMLIALNHSIVKIYKQEYPGCFTCRAHKCERHPKTTGLPWPICGRCYKIYQEGFPMSPDELVYLRRPFGTYQLRPGRGKGKKGNRVVEELEELKEEE